MSQNKNRLGESGAIILEFTIYFPFLFLAFLMFIFASLIVTQRVVLDRAVNQATLEAATFLSGANRIGECPFSGYDLTIRSNPYANLLDGRWHPLDNRNAFYDVISDRVEQLAGIGVVGGLAGDVDVTPTWAGFLVGGDLTVNATQGIHFPIAFFGTEEWTFESTATVRVFNPHSLMNDAQFVFDVARLAGFDLNNIFGDLVGRTVDAISQIIVDKVQSVISDMVEGALRAFSPI